MLTLLMLKKLAPKNIICRPFERDEWGALRDIRLEALKTEPGVYTSTYQKEKDLSEERWRDTAQSDNCVVFGLFADKPIGMIGIATLGDDPSGESAVLWGTYIKSAFRGNGLSGPLYKTSIAYAAQRKDWQRIVISHRNSNEPSKRPTLAHGFKYTHTEHPTWPDGKQEDESFYVLELDSIRK